MNQRELIARFNYEFRTFGDPSKGETRTVIGIVDVDGDGRELKIKGPGDEGELSRGLIYRFYGRHVNHPTYGDQFQFDSFVMEKPAGREAVVTYLCQIDGIGPKKAAKLWDTLGDNAVEQLRDSPEKVGKLIGLKPEQIESAGDFLKQQQAVEKTSIELYGLLHGRGLPRFKKLVEQLIRDHGMKAAQIIRRNPYLLMAYGGIGFMRADKMYLEFGPDDARDKAKHAARLKRQALCAWHAIATARDGDSWFGINVIRDALNEKISGARIELEKAIKLAIRADMLEERVDRGQRWFAESAKARAEQRVARFIAEAAEETEQDGTQWPDVKSLSGKLSDHQFSELQKAIRGIVCVLAGSPGTGKTYSTAAIIRIVMQGGHSVAACAPTGKAAVRLTEALNANGIDLRATTIHSLLSIASGDGDGWSFLHHEFNPLPHAFVFIDESSMIDTSLMASLLAARARGTHFLFIGDPNQLAPVGHGAPLRDLITAKVPTGTLTEIKRQGVTSRVVVACAEIRDKRRFSAADKPDLDAGENLVLIPQDAPEQQIETLEILMQQFMGGEKYDPVWDVQIIVAVNKRSPLGRRPLNDKLQELLNPDGQRVKGNPFRVGDKIICVKNSRFPSLDPEAAEREGKTYVANGEQAEVVDVSLGRTIVRLTSPDREIVIPRSAKESDEDNKSEDDTGTGCNWELGYAISCHKSQGSEWRVVIVLADEYGGAKMVQSRQYLYTAISRAKTLCLVVGKQSVCDEMCRRDALFKRKTFLVEQIGEMRNRAFDNFDFDAVLEGVLV